MTPEERDLLKGLFGRLELLDGGGREAEAEAAIAAAIRAQPSAPYYMTQLLLVQDQALSAAQTRIRQLEREAAGATPPARPPASFLGEAQARRGGPWGPAPARAAEPLVSPAPGSAPPDSLGASGSRPSPVGGFLRGAMQTAAGVAGGALLFEGINSLFHHSGGGWGSGLFPSETAVPVVEQTIVEQFGAGQPLPAGSEDRTQEAAADAPFLPPESGDADGDVADADGGDVFDDQGDSDMA